MKLRMAEPQLGPHAARAATARRAAGGGEQRVEQGGFPAALRADERDGSGPRPAGLSAAGVRHGELPSLSGRAVAARKPGTAGGPARVVVRPLVAAGVPAPPGRARAPRVGGSLARSVGRTPLRRHCRTNSGGASILRQPLGDLSMHAAACRDGERRANFTLAFCCMQHHAALQHRNSEVHREDQPACPGLPTEASLPQAALPVLGAAILLTALVFLPGPGPVPGGADRRDRAGPGPGRAAPAWRPGCPGPAADGGALSRPGCPPPATIADSSAIGTGGSRPWPRCAGAIWAPMS